uniref:Response regulator n=1 Tax=Schlesneria paludicola TaxID=360056 RepID=A0A7C4LK33_9PLAN
MKVLVVDDVGFMRHYLERLLRQNGYQVCTAASASEALQILKSENAIEVVLTDLMMPGMDGIALFKAARTIDRFNDSGPLPPPAFLLITAMRPTLTSPRQDANLFKEAIDLGFVDVLLKPVDQALLLRRLRELRRQRSGGSESTDAPGTVTPDSPSDWSSVLQVHQAHAERLYEATDRTVLLQFRDQVLKQAAHVKELLKKVEQRASEEQQFAKTLQSLREAADSVLAAKNESALLAICEQLEARARQIKQKLTGPAGGAEATPAEAASGEPS